MSEDVESAKQPVGRSKMTTYENVTGEVKQNETRGRKSKIVSIKAVRGG